MFVYIKEAPDRAIGRISSRAFLGSFRILILIGLTKRNVTIQYQSLPVVVVLQLVVLQKEFWTLEILANRSTMKVRSGVGES